MFYIYQIPCRMGVINYRERKLLEKHPTRILAESQANFYFYNYKLNSVFEIVEVPDRGANSNVPLVIEDVVYAA